MAIDNIDSNAIKLGKILQIAFSNGVRNQLSEDYRDFEYVGKYKVSKTQARELRFMLQTSFGPAAVQYRNPGQAGGAFPKAQQISIGEKTAKFKEMAATVELEYNLWDRARKSPEKYAEPLALEISSKATAAKRRLAADWYGDGTGVLGTVASAAVTSPASDKLVFTLSSADSARGHVGNFEYGDILVLKAAAGSASALNTNLATEPAFYQVVEKDRDSNTVTLQGLDSSYNSAGTISSISAQPTAGDVFYRVGQGTILDLTSAISDYGFATEVLAGLESLTANDGRTIHDIVMSGATAGSRLDAGNQPLDVKYIQKALDKVKIAVGADKYKWKMMCMSPEAQSSLIESRETDRRFQTVTDNKRGVNFFAYVHGNDTLETVTSEFCPQKRIYMIPEAKSSDKILEFWGSDFESVKGQGMNDWHLKVSSGEYVDVMVNYMISRGVFICKHPAAIAALHNFTV